MKSGWPIYNRCPYCKLTALDEEVFFYVNEYRRCPQCKEVWRHRGKKLSEVHEMERTCPDCNLHLIQIHGGTRKIYKRLIGSGIETGTGFAPYIVVICPSCEKVYDTVDIQGEMKEK